MHYTKDYADAVAHAARVKPLRGDAQGRRPYAGRKHGRTFYITDEGERGVAVTLYSTVIVRFMPDGTIMVDGTYRSKTTAEALWQVLGSWAGLTQGKMWIATDKGRELLDTSKPTPMVRTGDRRLAMVSHTPSVIHRIDRKGMNAVWRRYAAFRDYLHVTLSLGGEQGYSQAHVASVLGWSPTDPRYVYSQGKINSLGPLNECYTQLAAMMRPDADAEAWAKAAMKVMLYRNSYYITHFYGEPSPTRFITFTDEATVLDTLRHVLRYAHRDEVFKEIEVPAGEIAHDRYAPYFA
jgi:hypothetical protein